MTKRACASIFSVAILLLLTGCAHFDIEGAFDRVTVRGSGTVVSESRDVRGFREVALTGVGEVIIEQAGEESLTIEAEDNILPRLRSTVEGDRLVLGVERGVSVRPTRSIVYRLKVKEIEGLEISGSGKMTVPSLRSQELRLRLPGSGAIRLDRLTADRLQTRISGSGDVRAAGTVGDQEVSISGSGDFDGRDLESRSAEISISGSGESTVWARERLSARISGSGDVDYYGSPEVTKRISGSGSVRSRGDRSPQLEAPESRR